MQDSTHADSWDAHARLSDASKSQLPSKVSVHAR